MLIGFTAVCQLVSLNWNMVVFSCGCKNIPAYEVQSRLGFHIRNGKDNENGGRIRLAEIRNEA